jgi:hypothetical protein
MLSLWAHIMIFISCYLHKISSQVVLSVHKVTLSKIYFSSEIEGKIVGSSGFE